jgi:hypothetical protein
VWWWKFWWWCHTYTHTYARAYKYGTNGSILGGANEQFVVYQ